MCSSCSVCSCTLADCFDVCSLQVVLDGRCLTSTLVARPSSDRVDGADAHLGRTEVFTVASHIRSMQLMFLRPEFQPFLSCDG